MNLSALRREREQGPAWLPTVLEAIKATGTEGMKPSAVAELVGKDRKTVRAALQAAVERGQLVYRDNGPHSVHPDTPPTEDRWYFRLRSSAAPEGGRHHARGTGAGRAGAGRTARARPRAEPRAVSGAKRLEEVGSSTVREELPCSLRTRFRGLFVLVRA
ncbi:hypothetical protein [Streptomyces brasiliensis]|uniref:Uncharacterized protein n=1 Tax=Streptomyces brasiliensis TaxID=1954 RepID=A0A917L614_9ACTN|nr:hypothetical protein [Streptomyces brasiliensis]GGJ46733.1 hypothetical protein GCM10010121_067590 [Streptomyces brasiliensis]